jgi:hypothetical protein
VRGRAYHLTDSRVAALAGLNTSQFYIRCPQRSRPFLPQTQAVNGPCHGHKGPQPHPLYHPFQFVSSAGLRCERAIFSISPGFVVSGPGSGSSISLWLADTNSALIPDCNLLLITQTCHPAGWQRSSNNANYPRFSFTGHRGNGHPHGGAWKLNRTHRTCVAGGESVGPPKRIGRYLSKPLAQPT